MSVSRHVRERGLDLLCYHPRGLFKRNLLTDHGNRWEYNDTRRLGNATLDDELFWLVTDGGQPVLHAAEAKGSLYV